MKQQLHDCAKEITGALQQDRQPEGQMAKAANSLQEFLPRVVVLMS